MAVNCTKNVLRIFDKPVKGFSKTCLELPPERHSYINLHPSIKPKLFMQTAGYSVSAPFSFQEVGMPNVIKMRE